MPQSQKEFPFKIGADPEFSIQVQNARLHAQRTLKTLFDGPITSDSGNLGWDGHSATAEIRPKPSNSPKELVKNIGNLLSTLAKRVQFAELKTTSEKAPVGGHIHLDYPNGRSTRGDYATDLCRRMSSLCLPLMLGENELNLRLRTKGGYGRMTDAHFQSMPGGHTFEYRTPSAEWLTTPLVAEATLSYVGVVWNEIINKPATMRRLSRLIAGNNEDLAALQRLGTSNYAHLIASVANKVKKEVRKFELYPQFMAECELAMNPKKMAQLKSKAGYDIIVGWNFNNTKGRPTKKQVTSQKQVQKRLDSMGCNIDSLTSTVSICYNEDAQVSLYANALSERIVAFGWKLQNDYFMFGLRNGVDEPIVMNHMGEFLYGAEQIKTASDLNSIMNTMSRMIENHRAKRGVTMNEEEKKKRVIVGIPYQMRRNNKLKPIMGLISDCERSLAKKAKVLTAESLKNTPKGKIAQAYSNGDLLKETGLVSDMSRELRARQNAEFLDPLPPAPRL